MTESSKAEFEEKQLGLLRGGNEQKKAFIAQFSDDCPASFSGIFDGWGLPNLPQAFNPPVTEWSEGEFQQPPWESSLEAMKSLEAFKPNELCSPSFWFAIHAKCVESGFLKRSWFAYGHRDPDGQKNIAQACQSDNKKIIDKCLRNILRHLGGIVIRYTRSVYLDCPTASMYWRCHMIREAKKYRKLAKAMPDKDLYKCLSESAVWRQLVEAATTRKTLIGESHIRAAFIVLMAEKIRQMKSDDSDEKKAKRVKNIIDSIVDLNLRVHMAYRDPNDIVRIFKRIPEIKNG